MCSPSAKSLRTLGLFRPVRTVIQSDCQVAQAPELLPVTALPSQVVSNAVASRPAELNIIYFVNILC